MSQRGLLKFILLSLAFTNSVTVPVGFPLKAYEATGFLAIFLMLTQGGFKLGEDKRIPALWAVFYFGSMVASAWGLYELWTMDLNMIEWAHGRFNPLINTIFHYIYLAFDIGLLVLVIHALHTGLLSLLEFCRWWLYGAILSVVYALVLNLVMVMGLPASLLLRFSEVYFMNVAGIPIARTGPFEEGNYFGLYLLVSLVINLYGLNRWSGKFFRRTLPLLFVCIVITASPAALLGMAVMVAVALLTGKVSFGWRAATIAGGSLGMAFLVKTGLFQTLVLDKFSLLWAGGVTDTRNVSLIQRLNESYHAWKMFLDHPQGVGMGNFGYFFGLYPDMYPWLVTDFQNFKPIPNNVFLEVLSEHGLLVFLLFVYILYNMGRRLLFNREFLALAGMVMMSVYFVAFPTFRLSLIWVFWGFLVYLGRDPMTSFAGPALDESSPENPPEKPVV